MDIHTPCTSEAETGDPWGFTGWPASPLEQCLSAFLMLQPSNMIPHVVVTPNNLIIPLLLHNCNFGTVMNRDPQL